MKKIVVLFILLMFIVSLCLGIAPSNVLAEEKLLDSNRLTYVALGDSMSKGFMFEDYSYEEFGWKKTSKDSYIEKFKKYIDANLIDLSIQGLQPDEVYAFLAPETYNYNKMPEPSQTHIKWWIKEEGSDTTTGNIFDTFTEMSDCYIEGIKQADVITYDIGINFLGTFITDGGTNIPFTELLRKSKCSEQIGKICNEIAKILTELGAGDVYNILNGMLYGCAAYMVYGDLCIAKIHELNPNAQIIFIPLSNPLRETYLDINGIKIDFSGIFDKVFECLNNYFRHISKNRGLYTIAEVNSPMISFADELYYYPDTHSKDVEKNLYALVTDIYGSEGNIPKVAKDTYLKKFEKSATYRVFPIDVVLDYASALMKQNIDNIKTEIKDALEKENPTSDDYIKLSFVMHFGDTGTARGFGIHPCPRGLDVKYDAIKKVFKPVKPNGSYEETESSELNEAGTYILRMNKKNAGEFNFSNVGTKWTIKDSDDKYLSISKSSLVHSDTAFDWDFENGYFIAKDIPVSSILPIKKTYYLTYNFGKLSITSSKYKAAKVSFVKKDNIEEPLQEFKVNVTVNEKTERVLLFLKKKTYEIKISVLPINTSSVSKIQYSFDNKKWINGASSTVPTEPKEMNIRVTDSDDIVHYYLYCDGLVTEEVK